MRPRAALRRPHLTLALALALAAAVCLGLASCGEDSSDADTYAADHAGAASAASQAEHVYRAGETAELFGLKLTVHEVQRTDAYNEQILQAGKTFALVRVTLENTSGDARAYHFASFDLLDSSGSRDLAVTTLNAADELHEGELAPGATVSGILPFEHPADDPVLKLVFTPNKMSDRTIVFDLG